MRPTAVALVAVAAVLVAAGGAALLAGAKTDPNSAIVTVTATPAVSLGTPTAIASTARAVPAVTREPQQNPSGAAWAPGAGDTIEVQAARTLAPPDRLLTPYIDVRTCPRFTLFVLDASLIASAGGRVEIYVSPDAANDAGTAVRFPDSGPGRGEAQAAGASLHTFQSLPGPDGGVAIGVQPASPYVRVSIAGVTRPIQLRPITLYCSG